jgi:hypothetical protein
MTGGSVPDGSDIAADGSTPSGADSGDEPHPTPAAAFQQLGNETRVEALRVLSAEGPSSFSTLFEASDTDTSAGFAYHLRQLDSRFVRQREDERWELTAAGREAARTVASGGFSHGVDHDDVPLEEACPLCREGALTLSVSNSIADVTCSGCGQSVMRLSFPPSGHIRDGDDLPAALDTYHRNRVRTFVDGVCPDCGGRVETTPELVESGEGEPLVAQLDCACTRCPASFDCPATLAVLDHPAVVSFYDDHGRDVTERPVWNVGPEWRERVLSTDPWCLLVSTRLDEEVLELYIGEDGTVHEHRRRSDDASAPAETTDTTAESGDLGDDAAA